MSNSQTPRTLPWSMVAQGEETPLFPTSDPGLPCKGPCAYTCECLSLHEHGPHCPSPPGELPRAGHPRGTVCPQGMDLRRPTQVLQGGLGPSGQRIPGSWVPGVSSRGGGTGSRRACPVGPMVSSPCDEILAGGGPECGDRCRGHLQLSVVLNW